ncbi:MAG: glycosyltransferase family 2 protein [Bacteroidota bacterium]|nr:glycosyltransferase family 2 protein [Bacteroidota bacterium]
MKLFYDIANAGFYVYSTFIIGYFIFVNTFYFTMLAVSFSAIVHYLRRNKFCDYTVIMQSELTPAISILAPAYNESATCVHSTHSLLKLNYPTAEVIFINDGSKDDTLEVMIREFGLVKTQRVYVQKIFTQPVLGIYISTKKEYKNLILVNKCNGGKADALNVGINVSRYPLMCAIDADSILEDDALLKVVKPFLDNNRVIAVGGIVRIANGCTVEHGRVKEIRLSKKFIPSFQVVEYFRAYLSGRMGWSALNGLLIISGAFGLFLKEIVLAVGGYKHDTVGEDMELVVRMHRHCKENKIPYGVEFVPDPVCWTEAPETLKVLGRQRNRWHRGLIDTLLIHKRMLCNPRYGVLGTLAVPYFFFIEMLGPIIEAIGYIAVLAGFFLRIINVQIFILFFVVSVVYGVMFSVGAVLLEEISFHRYPRLQDLLKLMFLGVIENFGYRQLTVWWRVRSFWDYFRGVKTWGAMHRVGFANQAKK